MTEYYRASPFYEYAGVSKRSRDLDRLQRLHEVRLTSQEALALVENLAKRMKGLTVPEFRFTGRTDRGHYEFSGTIIIRPRHISAEVLIHELAHHWNWNEARRLRRKHVPHGVDFTDCLDRLARATEEELVT